MTAIVHENLSLKPYNTFSIDVATRYFTAVNSVNALQNILSDEQWKTIPCFILGGGSNILFTRNFEGLVIHNQILGIEKIDETTDHVYLKIGAGEILLIDADTLYKEAFSCLHILSLYCMKFS